MGYTPESETFFGGRRSSSSHAGESTLQLVREFVLGLLAATAIGFLLGGVFNEAITGFDDIGDPFELDSWFPAFIAIQVVTLLFAVYAIPTKNFGYLVYPMLSMLLASRLQFTDLAVLLSDLTPDLWSIHDLPRDVDAALIAFSFFIVHCVVWPGQELIRMGLASERPAASTVALCLAIPICLLLSLTVASRNAGELLGDRVLARGGVHLPNSEAIWVEISRYSYPQVHPTAIPSATPLAELKIVPSGGRSSRAACGDKLKNHAATATSNWATSPRGVEYATAVITFAGQTSDSRYLDHLTCFALGSYAYVLIQSEDENTKQQMAMFPIEQVVDEFARAPEHFMECGVPRGEAAAAPEDFKASLPDYCTPAMSAANAEHQYQGTKRRFESQYYATNGKPLTPAMLAITREAWRLSMKRGDSAPHSGDYSSSIASFLNTRPGRETGELVRAAHGFANERRGPEEPLPEDYQAALQEAGWDLERAKR